MNAEPALARIAGALSAAKLEAILIGNAAAALRDTVRRLLALPMERRTRFLRRRLPGGGSAL